VRRDGKGTGGRTGTSQGGREKKGEKGNGWLTWRGTRNRDARVDDDDGTEPTWDGNATRPVPSRHDEVEGGAVVTSRKTTCKAADVTAQTKTFQEKTWSPIVYENGQKAHTLTQERFEVIQDLDEFANAEVRDETTTTITHARRTTVPKRRRKRTRDHVDGKKKRKNRRHRDAKGRRNAKRKRKGS